MQKAILFASVLAIFAFPVIAEEIPVGCIDFEYYSDLEYYGDFEVIAYGFGGIENRGASGTSELIVDNKGNEYSVLFTDEDVCIEKFDVN